MNVSAHCREGATFEEHSSEFPRGKLQIEILTLRDQETKEKNGWAPKGLFPSIMRILNGGFKLFGKPFRTVWGNDSFRITGRDVIKLEREHLFI